MKISDNKMVQKFVKNLSRFSTKNIKFITLTALLLTVIISNPEAAYSAKSVNKYAGNIIFSPDRANPVLGYHVSPITFVVGQSRKEAENKAIAARVSNTSTREVISRENTSRTSAPSQDEKRQIVKGIASRYGIDWKILEAVWEVESGKSWDRDVRSYAGAQGPMQFLPSTFRHYAPQGANINSALDSLEAGANLLSQAGARDGNVDKALFSYNHSTSYVNKVNRIANSIK